MPTIEENKKLIEKYPFLLPHNRWTDEVSEDYDYSYTEMDAMPEGWRIAFGDAMLEELAAALGDYASEYRITQIKEKYGGLRWYDQGTPRNSGTYEIIRKYEVMSLNTCIVCGKPATKISLGWISPYCDTCAASLGDWQDFIDINDYYSEDDDDDKITESEESDDDEIAELEESNDDDDNDDDEDIEDIILASILLHDILK